MLQYACGLLTMFLCLAAGQLLGATSIIYSNNFESYTTVATNLTDTADADPIGLEWSMVDDAALSPTTAGAGVQVINWLTNASGGANQALLLRPSSEAQVMFRGARSGSSYQLEFWTYAVRQPTSSQNFYVALRGEGADSNGDDYLAYQVNRATNSTILRYYDGVGPGAAAWVNTTANQTVNQWQHHKIVINPNALTFTLYVDDMVTPVVADVDISRCEIAVPTQLRIINEANSADDGYYAIDDISFTVEDSVDLTTTFTEGFENYTARTSPDDDADPQGPWITTEVDGTGSGRTRAPAKVQVVGSDVVPAHSGANCLKVEYGQRAGASIAWGTPPQSDVQITWWARVAASVAGQTANYLRMSLYGAEDNNTWAGDNALLGYGSRDATTGDQTSLTDFVVDRWYDTGMDYTPDAWEEYRLITYTDQGRYSIIKNPSTAPQFLVDRAPFINGATIWTPVFMAAWSSSNGTNHPPAYIDDIEIKSVASTMEPLPVPPYTTVFNSTRFTNVTKLVMGGPVGGVAVDPRDNSTFLFTMDAAAASGGGVYRASKVASGNWAVDPTPVVGNLANPSGLTIAQDGTIWWVHDVTMALMRLKAPWASNTPEMVVTNFGYTVGDDDPIDVCIAPSSFTGTIGTPNCVVVADRGADADPTNAVYVVGAATTALNQSYETNGVPPPAGWWQFLVAPTTNVLGVGNLNAIASLPASSEVVVLSQDGYITAIDANGSTRYIYPATFWPLTSTPSGAAIAVDPTTGRLWLADDSLEEIWSVDPGSGADQKELSFPLQRVEWRDQQIDIHDPGMTFAANGGIMVLSDTSTVNGGGRLLVFHNEAFAVPDFSMRSVARTAEGVALAWQSAGAVKYSVQRGTKVADGASFQNVVTNLSMTTLSFTDTNAPPEAAFYRVVAAP